MNREEESLPRFSQFLILKTFLINSILLRGSIIIIKIPHTHTLRKLICTGKDKLGKLSHSGVVYKITCKNCNASYVGQTKR